MRLSNDDWQENTTGNKNKIFIMLIGIVILTIIVVFALLLIVMQQSRAVAKNGILVNGKKIETVKLEDIVASDGIVYFPIKDIATSLGYKAYNGEYKVQTEQTDKCYVVNENESATFFENENYIYKMGIEDTDKNYKKYEIAQSVVRINDKLYVSAEGLSRACNAVIKTDLEKNIFEIYTLDHILGEYQNVASNKGLSLSYDKVFENRKAILNDWAVVSDSSNKYGIIDGKGNEILGIKYNNIEYDEYTDSFKITDTYNKVGIWKIENNEVIQKINNSYDSIQLIDKDKQLYLVSINGQYGVVNFEEQFVINAEYDQIGIDLEKFNVENKFIMYDKLIPVQKSGKWGVFNINGERVIPVEYDNLGCEISKITNQSGLENIVMVPEYGLIVLEKDGKYGLLNWKGEQIIAFALSAVYYSDANGQRIAYMESEGQQYAIVKFLDNDGRVEKYNAENDVFSDF